MSSKRRIAIPPPRAALAGAHLIADRDLAAFRQVHHRIEDDLIARLDAVVHFDFGAEVTRDHDLLQMDGAVLDDRDMLAVLIEYNRIGRFDHRWCLARDIQLDGAIDSGTESAPSELGTSTSVNSVRPPYCSALAILVTLPGKTPVRNLRDMHHGIDPWSNAERRVLVGHTKLGSDHVRVHQRIHAKVDWDRTWLPLSTLRCVMTPSNGATTRW